MKIQALLLISIAGSASAAPAIVWDSQRDAGQVAHSSKEFKAASLIENAVASSQDGSLSAVFLLNRNDDGSESFSSLASSGALPGVQSKYDDATTVHSHVSGIESAVAMSRHPGALKVSLSEFSSKMAALDAPSQAEVEEAEVSSTGLVSKAAKHSNSRARAISGTNVVVVDVPAKADPAIVDASVVQAIEHEKVSHVVLAGIRSVQEVKAERELQNRRRFLMQEKAGRFMSDGGRRLDEQNDQDGGDEDLAGVYYVHMTPNVFAGILFTFLFTVVTWIGVSCMGMIAGQDVYVKKMPTIGREA